MLSDSKIAIFCSGDNNYIPQMIMALTIACKKNRFDPFIITDASESELKLIHDAGINTIKVDLAGTETAFAKCLSLLPSYQDIVTSTAAAPSTFAQIIELIL